MKKLFCLLAFLLTGCLPAFAQRGYNSSIKIRLSDNALVRVAIDHRYYPREASLLTIGNIPPGRHRIKVFLASSYGRNRRAPVYDGYMRVAPSSSYYMIVDRNGSVRINTTTLDDTYYSNRDSRYKNKDYYDFNDKYDESLQDHPLSEDQHDDGYDDRRPQNDAAITRRDMEALEQKVKARITDTDKLRIIKTALTSRSYTTEQVRKIIKWLNFDSSKIDFAKWAYDGVSDRKNYWKLDDAFSFSSTKDELNDFLSGK